MSGKNDNSLDSSSIEKNSDVAKVVTKKRSIKRPLRSSNNAKKENKTKTSSKSDSITEKQISSNLDNNYAKSSDTLSAVYNSNEKTMNNDIQVNVTLDDAENTSVNSTSLENYNKLDDNDIKNDNLSNSYDENLSNSKANMVNEIDSDANASKAIRRKSAKAKTDVIENSSDGNMIDTVNTEENIVKKPKAKLRLGDAAKAKLARGAATSKSSKAGEGGALNRPITKKEKDSARKTALDAKVAPVSKNDTMKVYMSEIAQISLVNKNEEANLADAIHNGDEVLHEEARTILIKANLRLVVKIAHDFKGLGLPLLDLISEGNIGLMRAVEKFDPSKGAKFSSYAAWWIKQSMRRALANQSKIIRVPVQSAGKINKIKSVKMKLAEQLGREPTDSEIAEHLDFSERTVSGLRLADLHTFSLQDSIQQGEEGEFQDIIPDRHAMTPDQILGDVESISRLKELLKRLEDRERKILEMRFGLGKYTALTLEEVSQKIGRTRERVRQIQNQALSKLKTLLADESGFSVD